MTQDDIIKFLKMTFTYFTKNDDIKFCGKDHLILHYGKFFTEYANCKTQQGIKKQCFKNATDLCLQHNLIYCEGYATCKNIPFPIEHAWCIDINKKVIDNTWENEVGNIYLGIPFSTTFLTKIILKNGVYGIFDSPVRNWLYNGFSQDELWSEHKINPLI